MSSTAIEITAIDKTQEAFNSIKSGFGKLNNALQSTAGKIASLVGAAGFGAMASEALSTADAIGKTSVKLNIGTADLQKFQFAASQSGVGTDQFNSALKKFSANMGEAATGNKKLSNLMEDLGISLKDQNGKLKGNAQLFRESATAISNIQDPILKASAANQLFGKTGTDLIPLLNAGSAGIDAYGKKLEEAGGIMSDDFIKNAEATNDAVDTASRTIKASFTVVLGALLPVLQDAASYVGIVAKKFGEFAAEYPTLTKLGVAIGAVGVAISLLGGPITLAVIAIGGLIAAWHYFGDEIKIIKNKLTTIFNDFIRIMVSPIKSAIDTIIDIFNGLPEFMKNKLPADISSSLKTISEKLGKFKDGTETLIDDPIKKTSKTVSDNMDLILTSMTTKSKSAVEAVGTNFDQASKDVDTKLGEAYKANIDARMAKAKDALTKPVKDGVKDIFASFGELNRSNGDFFEPIIIQSDTLGSSLSLAALNAGELSKNLNSIAGGSTKKADNAQIDSALSTIPSGITGLNAGLMAFAAGAGPLGIAIAALTEALTKDAAFQDFTARLNETIGKVLAPAIESLVEVLDPLLPILIEFKPFFKELGREIHALAVNIKPFFEEFARWAKAFNRLVDEFPLKITQAWHSFIDPIMEIYKNFKKDFVDKWNEFFGGLEGKLGEAVAALNTLKEIIGENLMPVLEDITLGFKDLLEEIKKLDPTKKGDDKAKDFEESFQKKTGISWRTADIINDINDGTKNIQLNIYLDLEGQVKAPLSMFKTQIMELQSRQGVAV